MAKGGVLLVHHGNTRTRHVVHIRTFDDRTDIVAGAGESDVLMVHPNGEDLFLR